MLYLDTSALIKLYIREPGSTEVQHWVSSQDDPLPIWELQEMELVNALRLKVYWGDINRSDADRQISLFHERRRRGLYFFPELDRIQLMEKFHELSRNTEIIGSRTLDIQHVACASLLKPEYFITYDDRQRILAKQVGFNVLPR